MRIESSTVELRHDPMFIRRCRIELQNNSRKLNSNSILRKVIKAIEQAKCEIDRKGKARNRIENEFQPGKERKAAGAGWRGLREPMRGNN